MDIPALDKAIFLIDRKDLDEQTTSAFQTYANNDLIDVDQTENVNDLKKKAEIRRQTDDCNYDSKASQADYEEIKRRYSGVQQDKEFKDCICCG